MISEARGGLSGADNITAHPQTAHSGVVQGRMTGVGEEEWCSDSMVFSRCLGSDVRHIRLLVSSLG